MGKSLLVAEVLEAIKTVMTSRTSVTTIKLSRQVYDKTENAIATKKT